MQNYATNISLLEFTHMVIYLSGKRTSPGEAFRIAKLWGIEVNKEREDYMIPRSQAWEKLSSVYPKIISNRGIDNIEELYACAYSYYVEHGASSLYMGQSATSIIRER